MSRVSIEHGPKGVERRGRHREKGCAADFGLCRSAPLQRWTQRGIDASKLAASDRDPQRRNLREVCLSREVSEPMAFELGPCDNSSPYTYSTLANYITQRDMVTIRRPASCPRRHILLTVLIAWGAVSLINVDGACCVSHSSLKRTHMLPA